MLLQFCADKTNNKDGQGYDLLPELASFVFQIQTVDGSNS